MHQIVHVDLAIINRTFDGSMALHDLGDAMGNPRLPYLQAHTTVHARLYRLATMLYIRTIHGLKLIWPLPPYTRTPVTTRSNNIVTIILIKTKQQQTKQPVSGLKLIWPLPPYTRTPVTTRSNNIVTIILIKTSCLINLYWQKYKQTQQIYQASKKDCTQKPRSCTMDISKGDHDTVQG